MWEEEPMRYMPAIMIYGSCGFAQALLAVKDYKIGLYYCVPLRELSVVCYIIISNWQLV